MGTIAFITFVIAVIICIRREVRAYREHKEFMEKLKKHHERKPDVSTVLDSIINGENYNNASEVDN